MTYKKVKKKYLTETHQHLVEEWDFDKNGTLLPSDITKGSHKKVWWKCLDRDCGHRWCATIFNRSSGRGCPACAGRVVTENNNLAFLYPELVKEWSGRNKLRPDEVTKGAHIKVWWVCSDCAHEWRATINKRSSGRGCPACARQVVSSKNNLEYLYPEIAKEWDFDKNENLSPSDFTPGSDKKVWWKCSKCVYEWCAVINNRSHGSGCPACAGRVVSTKNNLEYLYPEIALEWNFDKNENLSPSDFTSGSDKKIWWVCSICRYEWRTRICSRTGSSQTGCPACAAGSVSNISQKWLDSLNIPSLLREHKINLDGSYVKVDGYDPKTNTVYEFLGDYWHGNPSVYSPTEINPTSKKTYRELAKYTFNRLRLLEKAGYKVIYIWENSFKELIKNDKGFCYQ